MMARIPVRFVEPPPSLPTDTVEARLESLLLDWGDWVRDSNDAGLGLDSSSPMFRDVRCGIDWSIDCYSYRDVARLETMNAAVDDLLSAGLPRWLVIHWHYAQGKRHKGPASWRNQQLPRFGSAAYLELLELAKRGIVAGLARRNAMHLIE
jgi:hypothetical protein